MKKLLLLIPLVASATACMETEKPKKIGVYQKLNYWLAPKVQEPKEFRYKHDFHSEKEALLDTIVNALNNHEDPAALVPLIRKLKLTPMAPWKYFLDKWADRAIRNSTRKSPNCNVGHPDCKKIQTDHAILLACSKADSFYGGPWCWPPHMAAAKYNNPRVMLAILDHYKTDYSSTTLAQTKKSIFTLFCCLHKSNITVPRDIKKLLVNSCIANLLPPRPKTAERLEYMLSWQTRGGRSAYDLAKEHATLNYDIELLNPETAHEQYRQAYLDHCTRFRKTIFK